MASKVVNQLEQRPIAGWLFFVSFRCRWRWFVLCIHLKHAVEFVPQTLYVEGLVEIVSEC